MVDKNNAKVNNEEESEGMKRLGMAEDENKTLV